MNKIISFFKNASSITLILIAIGLGICAKLLELRFADFAMGLQLLCFVFFFYAIIKFSNSKFR